MSPDKVVSKRQERREQIRRQEKFSRILTIGLIIVGAIFIVFAFIYPSLKPVLDIVTVQAKPRPNVDRNTMGDPNAPIELVVYSDFQCPYCERFFDETEPLLVQYYISTGKVRFVYRSAGNWVSDNIARATGATPKTESRDAALAAYCAADQGKFWEMHDALFANNMDVEDRGSFSDRRLSAIAESVNLNMDDFQDCYDSGKYDEQVDQDIADALAVEIGGTPFFVMTYTVNGEKRSRTIDGAQPFNTFQVELEAALNEINAQQ
ncbi:MAG: thioredoxin domain-containing protein [Chloroflexi bacterium]|nr:thioredoxin domain-containing protein [Chloroflexota bacterium]